MGWFEAAALAAARGAAEALPLGGPGHAALLDALLRVDAAGTASRSGAAVHLGIAAGLLAAFWRDWLQLLLGAAGQAGGQRTVESRHVLLLVLAAAAPPAALWLLLASFAPALTGSPLLLAGLVVANGAMLIGAAHLGGAAGDARRPIVTMTIADAFLVGAWGCIALLPGLARTGATAVGGLRRGLGHEAAIHFALLTLPPVMAALALGQALTSREGAAGGLGLAAVAACFAGAGAWLGARLLMRLVRGQGLAALSVFGQYCIALGGGGLAILLLR